MGTWAACVLVCERVTETERQRDRHTHTHMEREGAKRGGGGVFACAKLGARVSVGIHISKRT